MKTSKKISLSLLGSIVAFFCLVGCESNDDVKPQQDILPASFSVDIPSTISHSNSTGGRIGGRTKGDTLQGNDIYLNLQTFIAVGEGASDLVEAFIGGIRKYNIDRIQSLTFISDDDGRSKNLVVLSEVAYENQTWDYEMTITDAESESQADGGKALQIFWNKEAKVSGIAIIKPYNCDRKKNAAEKDAMFRIDYTENSPLGYDAQMEVSISGLPLADPTVDPFSVNTLRMFAGKKGDVVDVYGNTNHPNAVLFTGDAGFNWAFVAAGNDVKNTGVAEVGLPPSSLDKSDRTILLKDYSIRNVFTTQITKVWPGIDQDVLAAYLKNIAAPGYFNKTGFIKGGTSPGADWDVLAARLDALSPYNPKQTSQLVVKFK